VLGQVHIQANSLLAKVALAFGRFRRRLCARKSRQEHASQNRDDRDHDQQFDERERGMALVWTSFHGATIDSNLSINSQRSTALFTRRGSR
jgi:hypothetical protein